MVVGIETQPGEHVGDDPGIADGGDEGERQRDATGVGEHPAGRW